ncbi:MAG: hypothetical protein MJ010_07170, partial [Paludibacteraceae bacterium]|nr:hypothetical protein [Paludibacteraceae bacterium]
MKRFFVCISKHLKCLFAVSSLFLATVGCAQNAGFFSDDAAGLTFNLDGSTKDISLKSTGEADVDLGTVKSFSLSHFYVNTWKKKNVGNVCYPVLYYRIYKKDQGKPDFTYKEISTIDKEEEKDGSVNQHWVLDNVVSQGISGDEIYVFEFYVRDPGSQSNPGQCNENIYLNNGNGENYKFYFSANETKFTVTASAYEVSLGESVTLTAHNGQAPYSWSQSTDGGSSFTPISGTDATITVLPTENTVYRCVDSKGASDNVSIVLEIVLECDPASKKNLFKDDFGTLSGDQERKTNKYIPGTGAGGYEYADKCKPLKEGGQYAVVANPKWGGCGDQGRGDNSCDCGGNFWYRDDNFKDHTGNGEYGGMLMIDCKDGSSSDNDILYERKAEDLCANTYTMFSLWVANAANKGKGDPIRMKFKLWNEDKTKVISEAEVDGLSFDEGWQEVSTMFNTGNNTSVWVQVVNKAGYGAAGNDVLIDDVSFDACNPKSMLFINGKSDSFTGVCGQDVDLSVSISEGALVMPYYLWQQSLDGSTWSEIEGVSGYKVSKYTIQSGNDTYYRAIVANDKETAEEVASGSATGKCALYSITNMVKSACDAPTLDVTSLEVEDCQGFSGEIYKVTLKNPFDYDLDSISVMNLVAPELTNVDYSASVGAVKDNIWKIIPFAAKSTATLTVSATANTAVKDAENKAYVLRINDGAEYSYDTSVAKGTSTITIFANPEAAISGPSANICEGSSADVVFTISSGTPNYTLYYKEGSAEKTESGITAAGDKKISVTPTETTTYTLTKVSDANGCYTEYSSENTAVVNVDKKPSAAVIVNPDKDSFSQCGVESFSLEAVTPEIGTGKWTITEGTIANPTSASTTTTVAVGSTVTVTWTVSNGVCESKSKSVTLKNAIVPTIEQISASGTEEQTKCSGEAIDDFTFELGGSATGYTISSDLSSSGLSCSLVSGKTYKISGTPSASCDVTISTTGQDEACDAATLTFKVTVNPLPTEYTIDGGGTYCSNTDGKEITLSGSENGVDYTLYKDGVATSVVKSGSGSALSFENQKDAGEYTILAKNTTTKCEASMSGSVSIQIDKKPTNNAGVDQDLCNTADFTLAGTATNGKESTWSIKSYTGETNPTITDPTSLTSTVTGVELEAKATLTLTTTSELGVCEAATDDVTLYNKDCTDLTLTVTAESPICAGETSNYKIEVYNGALVDAKNVSVSYTTPEGDTYTWTIGDIAHETSVTPKECQFTPTSTATTGKVSASAYVKSANGVTYASYEEAVSKDKKDIQVNALPVAGSMNVFDNTQCKQPYNGTYTITAEGGSGTGYSYSIDNGENYSSISKYERLQSANVTAKVKDSNGCESKGFAIKVEDKSVAPESSFEVTGGGSYCADGDGMPVGLNGSETGFTYTLYKNGVVTPTSLSGNGSALNFGNQKVAGTYTVVAGNSVTECSATMTGSVTVTVNDVPTIMETVSAKCADDLLSYSIVVTVSEGEVTCSEHATITHDGNVWTISGVATGHDCTLTVTTSEGCTNTMSVIAPNCDCPSIDAPAGAVNSSYCKDSEKSAIKVNTPTEEYAIYWYDAAIGGNKVAEGASYTPETPGTYYAAKVQKVSGCQSSTRTPATQTENALPIAGKTDVTDNTQCIAPFNGAYTITAEGGSGVYTYSIDGGATYSEKNIYEGLQSADVQAKVKDANDCVSSESVAIKVEDKSVSPKSTFEVTGGGSYCADGEGVTVGLSGSEIGFTYTLYKNDVATSTSLEGTGSALDFGKQKEAGVYTVKAENITTACSAIMTGSKEVSIYELPIAGKTDVTDNTQCIAPFNGAYTITATGGSGVYTYSIDGGATYTDKNIYEGLQKADVQAKVKDENGCVSSESVAIKVEDKSVAPKSTFEVTGGGSYCSGGEGLSVGLNGSETGFTYTLYKGETEISSLAGTGSALDFGKQTEAGVYTVKAKNTTTACSATMTGSATVSIYELPIAGSMNVINNTNCKPPYNGSYKITAEGGSGNYSYSNNNGESYSSIAIYERLQSADVIAKVRDSNGCESETGINIKVEDKSVTPTTTFVVTGGGSYCEGGDGVSVGLNGSETGFTYTLYKDGVATSISLPGNGSVLNFGNQKVAGTYTVVAENPETKCSGTMSGSTTVTVNAKPTIKEDVSAKCAPDLLSYSIVVTVSEGTVTCSESAEITNVGNVWTISGVAAGHDCTLTVTTSAGCINTMSVTAPECKCPSIEAPSGAVSSSYCIGSEKSAIKVNSPTEEYAIYWYDAATDGNKVAEGASYTPENPGTYYAAKVQVVSGCQSSTRTPATQTENALPTPTAGSNTPICSGTSLNLSVGPYSSYSWSGPSEFVSTKQNPVIAKATVSASGDYTVEVTDANGCKNTSTTSVTVNALPEAKIEGDAAVCQSSTLTLIGSGADKYSWNGGSYTTVGTYTVSTVTSGSQTIKLKVRDANGCTSPEVSKPITVNAKPEITETVAAKCADDLKSYSIVVTVSEGTVTCSQSATITNVGNVWTISGVATGHDCTLTVTTSEGCTNTMSVIAPNCDCPSIDAPAGAVNSSYCKDSEKSAIKVNTPTEEYAIYWYDAAIGGNKVAEGASYTPETPGTYYAAKVQKVSGCQSSTRTPATQTENALPIAGKTDVTDNTQCIAPFNGSYTITAEGGSGTGYSYSVDGGEYKTKSKYEELQSADVTVKVKDSNGCVSESIAIKVDDKSVAPKSTFEVTGGGSYCADGEGMSVGLNGSETGFTYTLYKNDVATSTSLE